MITQKIQASGKWRINNAGASYNGDLYFDPQTGIILVDLYMINKKPGFTSIIALPIEIDMITGVLAGGANVTLKNCTRYRTENQNLRREVFGYQAKYLFDGVRFRAPKEMLFSEMWIHPTDLLEWSEKTVFVIDYQEEYEFSLGAKAIAPIEVFEDEDKRIEFRLGIDSYPMWAQGESVTLHQTAWIAVMANTPQPMEFFSSAFQAMIDLLEIACGEAIQVTRMVGLSPAFCLTHGKQKLQKPIDIYPSGIIQQERERLRSDEMLFTLDELTANGNLTNWFSKAGLLEPIVELYTENVHSAGLSLPRRFLNTVQALETYHSRMVHNGTEAQYEAKVIAMLDRIQPANRDSHERALLADCTRKNISLKARLYDLITADFKVYLPTNKRGPLSHRREFAQRVADTRNYLTHYKASGKEKAYSREDLETAYRVLNMVLEYYLLTELGFSCEYAQKKSLERIRGYWIHLDIKQQSKEKQSK